jgi:predicted hydrocarbon binding protein/KaiC/GvpD/RAD55 family RecA-like ATPase
VGDHLASKNGRGKDMERSGVSLAEIQEVPRNSLMLLSGPPGAGKSIFCHQVVLNGLALDKPVIFVTTDHGPAEVIGLLREKGMMEFAPGALSFVDAFGETVGVTIPERPDTIGANCEDLNSISMAITKLQERIGRRDVLLAFDSLTSPYLFNEKEVFRFMRLCLAKFASEGNSVLALMDEGCGKEEDLGAMMSVADGILRMETKERSRTLNVVKHPRVEPARIEVPIEPRQPQVRPPMDGDPDVLAQLVRSSMTGKAVVRPEVGDFVNLFWPNLAHWSCILWDPQGFPTMLYDMNKYECTAEVSGVPWSMRLGFKVLDTLQSLGLYMPKSPSKVEGMKKMSKTLFFQGVEKERSGILQYLEDVSRTDEHYFRVYESSDCVGFENIGVPMASHLPPYLAGCCESFDKDGREWNAIETRCIGLGDPYCELRLVPGEIDGLKAALERDSSFVERIHERLMERLMGFLLDGKPLAERPRLGSDVFLHVLIHGMGLLNLVGERYRRAQMMGAARSAKMMGQRLMEAGLGEDEALERVVGFLEHCKVGKVTLRPRSGQALGETIRIRENCETLRTTIFEHRREPSCFFTTGFLNGLFSALKGQHVRETKCIAAGDPYCEWEIIS